MKRRSNRGPLTGPEPWDGGFPTIESPAYSVLDLNGGVAIDRVTLKVFARNLLDSRAILHKRLVGFFPADNSGLSKDGDAAVPVQSEAFIIQPRTIGVGFDYSF